MNEKKIKVWLLERGFRQAEIARDVGVSKTLVCHTIQGKEKNRRVINWFLAKGCPSALLINKERAA